MSKSVSVIITDDLDGSENAETVSFGFDGVTYEVDLGKKNRARLEKALAPFIEAGRPAPRRGRRLWATRSGGTSASTGALSVSARAPCPENTSISRANSDIRPAYRATQSASTG